MGNTKGIDRPEHVSAVERAVKGLDGEKLASEMNRHSGGSLNAKAALNVARLVGLAALRSPGRAVLVAGAGAQMEGDELVLFTGVEVARTEALEPKVKIEKANQI